MFCVGNGYWTWFEAVLSPVNYPTSTTHSDVLSSTIVSPYAPGQNSARLLGSTTMNYVGNGFWTPFEVYFLFRSLSDINNSLRRLIFLTVSLCAPAQSSEQARVPYIDCSSQYQWITSETVLRLHLNMFSSSFRYPTSQAHSATLLGRWHYLLFHDRVLHSNHNARIEWSRTTLLGACFNVFSSSLTIRHDQHTPTPSLCDIINFVRHIITWNSLFVSTIIIRRFYVALVSFELVWTSLIPFPQRDISQMPPTHSFCSLHDIALEIAVFSIYRIFENISTILCRARFFWTGLDLLGPVSTTRHQSNVSDSPSLHDIALEALYFLYRLFENISAVLCRARFFWTGLDLLGPVSTTRHQSNVSDSPSLHDIALEALYFLYRLFENISAVLCRARFFWTWPSFPTQCDPFMI